jgi:hypothetical protein
MAQPVSGIPFRTEMVGDDKKVKQPTWKQWFDSLVARVNGAPDPQTFDTLAVSPAVGTIAVISDSTTQTWGAVVAGGGGFTVLAWFGANGVWTVYGKS